MLDFIPEMLEQLEKEDVMEMRRRGRVFLARIDDAQGEPIACMIIVDELQNILFFE